MSESVKSVFLYLPIIEENLLWDLYLTGIGTADIPANTPYPPPGHPEAYDFRFKEGRVLPEYQVIYISKGGGIFESVQTGTVPVKAGDFILLFPGVWHRYKPDEETGWKEHWISWNGEYLYRLFKRGFINLQNPVITASASNQVVEIYNYIWNLAQQDVSENAHQMAACTMQILTIALQSNKENRSLPSAPQRHETIDSKDELFIKAVQLIWSHAHRNMSVNSLVEELPTTRRTLERRFKKALGYSIGREITICRIERAKHMLGETNLPIEHIALAVGFSGADRLAKVFRIYEKCTPGQYRKKQRREL
jgi:AraC-like DNA-binding protein